MRILYDLVTVSGERQITLPADVFDSSELREEDTAGGSHWETGKAGYAGAGAMLPIREPEDLQKEKHFAIF